MRRSIITAALGGLVAAAAFTLPANATDNAAGFRVDEMSSQQRAKAQPRSRTRITVQRRHYLDVGTDSLPGENKYNDYAIPPTYSVTSVIDRTNAFPNEGLPGPFDLPSKRNPRQF